MYQFPDAAVVLAHTAFHEIGLPMSLIEAPLTYLHISIYLQY